MSTLFVSDVHLEPGRPHITEAFLGFLGNISGAVRALYILGDLFEVWVGDDFEDTLTRDVANTLTKISAQGTELFFMHGNRDFLLGEAYAEQCGFTILKDPHCIDLYGVKTLLMHGDSLCTRDIEYINFRNTVRHPAWQSDFLAKPLGERLKIAQNLREKSITAQKGKSVEIMDVTPSEVVKTFEMTKAQRLIHGHTHRPKVHTLKLGGQTAQRIVLGDWYQQGSALIVNELGFELKSYTFTTHH